jgi:hypothetical protein
MFSLSPGREEFQRRRIKYHNEVKLKEDLNDRKWLELELSGTALA